MILLVILFSVPVTVVFFVKFFTLLGCSMRLGISFYLVLLFFPLAMVAIGYLFLVLFTQSFFVGSSFSLSGVLALLSVVLFFMGEV